MIFICRVQFAQCEQTIIHRKNGEIDVFLEGMCKRTTPKPFAVTTMAVDKGISHIDDRKPFYVHSCKMIK